MLEPEDLPVFIHRETLRAIEGVEQDNGYYPVHFGCNLTQNLLAARLRGFIDSKGRDQAYSCILLHKETF